MNERLEAHPLAGFLSQQRPMILDGGLATTLEARGHDLEDDLWSAKILLEDPEAIRRVHGDFLRAGADCIVTSTYQASLPGFRARGLDDLQAAALLRRSVQLALEARDAFWAKPGNRAERVRPLVAVSIGPYGAFLADGSEYTGEYSVKDEALREFHHERWSILADANADLLACETLPSRREADVLLDILRDPAAPGTWMSFSCRDGSCLRDGSPFADVVRACDDVERVVAIGINCTEPRFVAPLLVQARGATSKPLLAYPNAGGHYDAVRKRWQLDASAGVGDLCREWARLGAAAVGGCCRVTPEDIREVRRQLL